VRPRSALSILPIIGVVFAAINPTLVRAQGTWTPLAHEPPGATIGLMILLPDGTVMGHDTSINWYRLTPDNRGSYVNGTWTTLAPMNESREYFGSQVLTDGRLFVVGGEYGTGEQNAEVYDPATNIWTPVIVPSGLGKILFDDCETEMLPDGTVLISPKAASSTAAYTLVFDPITNTISTAPVRIDAEEEESWVKLPDNSILQNDVSISERFIPSQNEWIYDSDPPVDIWAIGETGAALLLPNGKAFFLGASGNTLLYTPSGNATPGTWSAGPVIPDGNVASDAPAAMLVTGNMLCAFQPGPATDGISSSTAFYEYDPVANSFTNASNAPASSATWDTGGILMLDLPDGTVLVSYLEGNSLYVYTPSGAPIEAGKPSVASITQNGDGSFHLVGTLLNGISAGAAYGDDAQMDTNRPLVRLTDSGGNVSYARTYNWSSTGVATGSAP